MKFKLMYSMVCFAVLLLSLTRYVTAEDAGGFPGVQKLMPKKNFDRAGLYKLNAEEITALNDWLAKYTANSATILPAQPGVKKRVLEEGRIEAKISGDFTGWSGETLFHLDNGQVWQQRLRGRNSDKAFNPEITITKNWMGFYELTLVKSGRSIGVKRIK